MPIGYLPFGYFVAIAPYFNFYARRRRVPLRYGRRNFAIVSNRPPLIGAIIPAAYFDPEE